MKIGNTAPRVGIEPTSLAFWASVLTITPRRLPDITTIPAPPCLCSSVPQRSVQTTTVQWFSFKMCTILFVTTHSYGLYSPLELYCEGLQSYRKRTGTRECIWHSETTFHIFRFHLALVMTLPLFLGGLGVVSQIVSYCWFFSVLIALAMLLVFNQFHKNVSKICLNNFFA